MGYSEAEKAPVRRALLERLSLRGLERVFGLSRRTVARWLVHWACRTWPIPWSMPAWMMSWNWTHCGRLC